MGRVWSMVIASAILAMGPLAARAAAAPFVIGSASHAAGSYFLDVKVTQDCPKGELVQVVGVEVGAAGAVISAVDSEGVNIYQAGGGSFKGPLSEGDFLATTSPQEPTNAGLRAGDVITLTYSKNNVWQGAIAECVPGIETQSGSADNEVGTPTQSGDGRQITLTPPPQLEYRDEPLFVASIVTGAGAGETWTESNGYTTLLTLRDGNTLNLAYQIVPSGNPTFYSAVNSLAHVWSTGGRAYKTTPLP